MSSFSVIFLTSSVRLAYSLSSSLLLTSFLSQSFITLFMSFSVSAKSLLTSFLLSSTLFNTVLRFSSLAYFCALFISSVTDFLSSDTYSRIFLRLSAVSFFDFTLFTLSDIYVFNFSAFFADCVLTSASLN